MKGSAIRGALAADPRGGRVTSLPVGRPPSPGVIEGVGRDVALQRLSPGVYRNPQGQLVNSSGRPLPDNRPQPINTFGPKQPAPLNDNQGYNPFGRMPTEPQVRFPAPISNRNDPNRFLQEVFANNQNLMNPYLSNNPSTQGYNRQNPMLANYRPSQQELNTMSYTQPYYPSQQFGNAGQMYGGYAPQQPGQIYGGYAPEVASQLAVGPGGQQMTQQQLEQLKQQNPNLFKPVNM